MLNSIPKLTIYNFALFQGAWFACVMFANYWAIVVILPFLVVQFVLGSGWRQDMRTGVTFVLVGALCESFLLGTNAVAIDNTHDNFPPIWLLCLWFVFGVSTHYSLEWLRQLKPLPSLWQAVFAAIFAPIAYLGAERLGALELHDSSLYFVAISWAITFPIALLLTNREVQANAREA